MNRFISSIVKRYVLSSYEIRYLSRKSDGIYNERQKSQSKIDSIFDKILL